MKVSGKFDVKLNPVSVYSKGQDGIKMGRMTIDKVFHGDLDATSKGEMLSAMTAVKGSAGYVAIEQVRGNLAGKYGSFVLQHFGTLAQGDDFLLLEVVPDSGTGLLEGISGKMSIDVREGVHYYELDYEL